MTPNEIQMLICGIAIGTQAMNLLHAYWNSKDARQAAVTTRAALKRAAGDRYYSSLVLYQLQNRSRV